VLKISVDTREVEAMLRDLRAQMPNRVAAALNRTATSVRAEAVRKIRERRALPAATVRDALTIRRAIKGYLVAEIVASGKPIPLRDYSARAGKKGVTVKVSRQGGRKGPVRKFGNKAFALAKAGGHVFVRTGPRRLPIQKLFGPSIPGTFLRKEVLAALRTVAVTMFPKRLAEAARYARPRG
jgi:hypothetical protein